MAGRAGGGESEAEAAGTVRSAAPVLPRGVPAGRQVLKASSHGSNGAGAVLAADCPRLPLLVLHGRILCAAMERVTAP